MVNGQWRAGVDIGGTFTDLLLVDGESGHFRVGKVLTTASEPAPLDREQGSCFMTATWLILPVVICLSQRLSHACLSISNLYSETANGSLKQL